MMMEMESKMNHKLFKILLAIFILICLAQAVSAKLSIIALQGTITDPKGNLIDGTFSIQVIGGDPPNEVDYEEDFTVTDGFFSIILGAREELNLICGESYELIIENSEFGSYQFTACKGDLYFRDIITVSKINVESDIGAAVINFSSGGQEFFISHCPNEDCGGEGLILNSSSKVIIQTSNISIKGSLEANSLNVRGEDLSNEIVSPGFCMFSITVNSCPNGWQEKISQGILRIGPGAFDVGTKVIIPEEHKHALIGMEQRRADKHDWDSEKYASGKEIIWTEEAEAYPQYVVPLVCCKI
jgi:hypothetical protein